MPNVTSPLGTSNDQIPLVNKTEIWKSSGLHMHFETLADLNSGVTREVANIGAASAIWFNGQPITVASEPAGVQRVWSISLQHARTVLLPTGVSVVLAAAGNTVLRTTGAPAGGTGAIGDLAVDFAAGSYYTKTGASVWSAAVVYSSGLTANLTTLDAALTTDVSGNLVIPANLVPRVGTLDDLQAVAGFSNEVALASDTKSLVLMNGIVGGARPINFATHIADPALIPSAAHNSVLGGYSAADASGSGVVAYGNTLIGRRIFTPTEFPNDGGTDIKNNILIAGNSINIDSLPPVTIPGSYSVAIFDSTSSYGNNSVCIGNSDVSMQNSIWLSMRGLAASDHGDLTGLLYARTTDATPTLLTEGLNDTWRVTVFRGLMILDVDVAAMMDSSSSSLTALYRRRLVMRSTSAGWVLKGSVQTPTGISDFTDSGFAPPAPTLSVVTGGLNISVTGIAATNIKWRAVIRASVLGFGNQSSTDGT
jgi:hypothetical protein